MITTTNVLPLSLLACSLLALGACAAPPDDDDIASESSAYREDAGRPSDTPPPRRPSPPKYPPPPITRPVVVAYPPSPPRVSDLALWLDPEVNLLVDPFSDQLVYWRDRAGLSDVKGSSVQTTTLGGRRAIVSVDGAVTATLAKSFGVRPFSIFMVERVVRPKTMGWLVRMNDANPAGGMNDFGIYLEPYEQAVFDFSFSRGTATTAGSAYALPVLGQQQTHILSLRRRDSHVALFVDDTPTYTSTGATTYDAQGTGGREQLVFGQVFDLAGTWNIGDEPGEVVMGDILVYDADLSDADVVNAKNFLRGHYGL